ncbi:MAG TPA: hypothetical protein VFB22_04515 [Candidatus Baltobacteraceae bacterium]|nr:hypothetical protein [Candidatus Baltobacteraceae bacterium]
MRGPALAAVLAAVSLLPAPLCAQEPQTVKGVLETLAGAREQPDAYTASVALHVRMRVFPFIRITLHGDSWYRRPGIYRYVFRGLPIAARAFSEMKYELGDPTRWPERYTVTFAPQSTSAAPVLRLTPKTAVLVRTLDIAVDPARGRILSAVWSRGDGGTIRLTQTYEPVGAHAYVAKQVATIDLPRMKAELEADYADFTEDATSVGTIP